MEFIVGKIINRLVAKKIIRDEEYEIYQFGLEQLLTAAVAIVSAIIIGMLFGKGLQCIVFLLTFMIIRSYAGGYHASTRLRCYFLTMFTILTALLVIKYIECEMFVFWELLVASSVIILMLSPVDTDARKLDAIECIYYRKKAMLIWFVEIVMVALCTVIHLEEISKCIILALATLSIAQIFEKLKYLTK